MAEKMTINRNLWRFLWGSIALLVFLFIWCRTAAAQQYAGRDCASISTGHRPTYTKGQAVRGNTVVFWQKPGDSLWTNCVLKTPAPTPPPTTPPDTTTPAPTPTPPPSGGPFAAPDLVSLNFNNPADDGKIKNGGADLVAYQTWDATGGRNGSRALKITVAPQFNDAFGPIGPIWPARGRVSVRWYARFQGAPSGNVKGFRFHNNFSNAGELYGGSPCWSFDWEPADAVGGCFDAGMSYGASPTATCQNLADGQWHWFEVDYDRNAGANVEVRLWCDGKAVVMPPGPARYFDVNTGASWSGGDRATNTPSTLRAPRRDTNATSGVYLWPTISQASGTATIWVDDVAASSQRIGP